MRTFQYLKKSPKVVSVDLSRRLYNRRKLAYDDKHRLIIIDDGVQDVQASIEAANCVSLAELCASMPGKSPLEKLDSALQSGLLGSVPEGESGKINDFTSMPSSVDELANVGIAARSALGGKKGDLAFLINEFVKEALAKQQAAAKANDPSKEFKE